MLVEKAYKDAIPNLVPHLKHTPYVKLVIR